MSSNLQNKPASEKFIWTINDFKLIPPAGRKFRSLILHRGHARKGWRFLLYPSSKSDENYMTIIFHRAYSVFDPMLYDASVSIKAPENKTTKCLEFRSIDFASGGVGFDKILKRDSFEKLPRSVTVECEITEVSEKSLEFDYSKLADFENLSSDFSRLLANPMHSDLTVIIRQYTFYLHTCILFARCRNFSCLLGYSSSSEMPNCVRRDIIDPYDFLLLIRYLYSGKCEKSYFPLMLLLYADRLKLKSLKQCFHERVQEHRNYTKVRNTALTIHWNLKEIQFRKECAVPFFQIFRTEPEMNYLAVSMRISEDCEGEKYIDVSFKVLTNASIAPVSLTCVLTLLSGGKICGYKNGNCNIEPGEEWHFPPFLKLSDIPEENEVYSPCLWLTAEISLSDGFGVYNFVSTKTRLVGQDNTPVVYPERLGSDIRNLRSPYIQSRIINYDILLKTVDDCDKPAHKAILLARWPAIRGYPLINISFLKLNIRSDELEILLEYIYTGSLKCLDTSVAEKLLQASAKMVLPQYLVNKCRYLLSRNESVREAIEIKST